MADYVPFYFGPRPPMLFSIKCGNTEYGRSGRGQAGMVHLVCRLESLARDFRGRWCFIDAHPSRDWARFSETMAELDERIDFDVMALRQWDQPDEVKAGRQAEFLVHGVVPWEYVELVVVMNEEIVAEVREVLTRSSADPAPEIRARPPGRYEESTFPFGYYY